MLTIDWNPPYKIKKNAVTFFRREWKISSELVSAFFVFWKNNKFKLLNEGFSIYKKDVNWFLTETKPSISEFKQFKTSSDNTTPPAIIDKDDGFKLSPITLKNSEGLRSWQITSSGYLLAALEKWGAGLDGSLMGLGKTYSAIGTVRELNTTFCIVCPKAVISQWKHVVDNHFKLSDKCVGIINYELLIRGKKDSEIASYIKKRNSGREEFTWKLPKNSIIIFDEAHKLKNWKTKNSKVCMAAFKQGYRMIFLSASIATTPLELRTIGTCLKMFKGAKEYFEFLEKNGCYKGFWGMEFNNDKNVLKKLHENLFSKRGIRLKRDEVPNFPECEIIVDPYDMDAENTKQINLIYEEMHRELKLIDKKLKTEENELTIRLRHRQKAELIKIPLITEMIEDATAEGMSVIVFLNFSASIDALAERLNTKCIFDGRQKDIVREKNKQNFQENKEKVIIINSAAGGTGVSLPDTTGKNPRLSIVSPDDNAFKMVQVQGRSNRENSKSKSIVRYVFIAGTIEETVSNNMKQKLDNLSLLNDGDLKI